VTSPLASIPTERRRRLATALGVFAVLFLVVGGLAATGPADALMVTLVVVALLVGVVLALLAWGVVRSIRLDVADRQLDAVIEQAVRSGGGSMCDCGHEHDPTEMHVVDAEESPDACAHDGPGVDCAHSCDTCALAGLRRSS
jgi:hypothetical protein